MVPNDHIIGKKLEVDERSVHFVSLIEEVQGVCDVVDVDVEEYGADGAALWYSSIEV